MTENEIAQIGRNFNGNHRVQVVSGKYAIYSLDFKTILEFREPKKCPTSIKELEPYINYKNCDDKELNILISWFSCPSKTFVGKLLNISNFEKMQDEFAAQNATLTNRNK